VHVFLQCLRRGSLQHFAEYLPDRSQERTKLYCNHELRKSTRISTTKVRLFNGTRNEALCWAPEGKATMHSTWQNTGHTGSKPATPRCAKCFDWKQTPTSQWARTTYSCDIATAIDERNGPGHQHWLMQIWNPAGVCDRLLKAQRSQHLSS